MARRVDHYDLDRELFEDHAEHAIESQTTDEIPRKRPGAAQQKASRITRKRAEAAQMGVSTRRRRQWEASPAGRERMLDVVDYATAQHNAVAEKHPELGLDKHGRINMSPAQLYEHYGFGEESRGPTMHEQQIPGLEDPHALPRPKRWEEHSPEEQEKIQRTVRRRTGATLESMQRGFGSQLDQSYIRAMEHGHDAPYSRDFYTSGETAQVLHDTARRRGVPLGLVAATNADTSPQMKFRTQTKTGSIRYPNAEQAEHAIKHVQDTGSPFAVSKEGLTGHALSGFMKNLQKAAHRTHQILNQGLTMAETFSPEHSGRKSGFGPKTAAYHNSWLTGTPDFFVSDIHSGGGGMLPHLSAEKPLQLDPHTGEVQHWESGASKRAKSEREKGIEKPTGGGFHAMADYAARQAMQQRGLGRVRQAQASQWGEERLRRGETAITHQVRGQFSSDEQVYPKKPPVNPEQFGQGRLF